MDLVIWLVLIIWLPLIWLKVSKGVEILEEIRDVLKKGGGRW